MKMAILGLLSGVVIVVALALSASCSNSLQLDAEKCSIAIKVSQPALDATSKGLSSRTLLPSDSSKWAIATYQYHLVGANSQTFDGSDTTGNKTFDNLVVGTWMVTVTAQNSSGVTLMTGSAQFAATQGSTTTVPVSLVQESGAGTVELTMSLPAKVVAVTGTIQDIVTNGATTDISSKISHGAEVWTYSDTLQASTFGLVLTLKDAQNNTLGMVIESLGVFANLNTNPALTMRVSDLVSYPATTPTFSPGAGTYTADQSVTISTTTPNATIYYTLDGSDPTTGSQQCLGAVSVAGNGTKTLKAIAVANGYLVSEIGSATYVINYPTAATPTFSPVGGTYTADQSVIITSITLGAAIYYTLDGTTPTISSNLYSGTVSISGNGTVKTIKAIAAKSGYLNSGIGSSTYTINYPLAATPSFSATAGIYGNGKTVSITCSTPNSTIYYTMDGSMPTMESLIYSGSITLPINKTTTVRAVAIAQDYSNSLIGSVTYTLMSVATTIAGTGVQGFSGDGGAANGSELNYPESVAVDAGGNVFFSDAGNNRVRKINMTTGIITTIAGNGARGFSGDGGPAVSASLSQPYGIAIDVSGNLYIADNGNNRIRRVDSVSGIIQTIAGNGNDDFGGDGGSATSACIRYPYGIAVDTSGDIYFADTGNYRIRKINTNTGVISTVAGNGSSGYNGDGIQAISASLSEPTGVAVNNEGTIFIADRFARRVRSVSGTTGEIATVAGYGFESYTGDGGSATLAGLSDPYGIAVDSAGNLYIADCVANRIRRVSQSTQLISTIAGTGVAGYGGDGNAAIQAKLSAPTGVVADPDGNIYIADFGNQRIREVTY